MPVKRKPKFHKGQEVRAMRRPRTKGIAILSAGADMDGPYRYRLWRRWAQGRTLVWVMLNPSTADEEKDDPTVRRCMTFASLWGYAGVEVVNLYALRATNKKRLSSASDPIGPGNDNAIISACAGRDVVLAWGAWLPPDGGHAHAVRVTSLLTRWADVTGVLGWTAGGGPRHPLYARADAALVPLRPSAQEDELCPAPRVARKRR